ncbi:MAG TPA: FecR domain-containing protein [Rhizomicrobium sp.]
MSDLSGNMPNGVILDELHLQASDWIERRDFGGWTNEDKAQFEVWLSESPAHRIAFLRTDTSWKSTEMLAALRPFRPDRGPPSPPRRARGLFLKIAASFSILAMLGAAGLTHFGTPRYSTYSTSVGGHRTLTLGDGSQIELDTDTVVRVAADQRKVILDNGQAYFQVKHNATHPFVVTVGNHHVTDLGTKFIIRERRDNLEVALVEGLARFDDETGGKKRVLTLAPGDTVRATADSLLVSRKSAGDLTNELGWRRGVLVFNQASLADVADEVNRYNQKKLIVADAMAARVNIGGTFRTNDVQAIANAARESFGLHVVDRGNEIVISR